MTRSRPGFTMLEIMVTVGIFAIGFVCVAAMFPAAMSLQNRAADDVTAASVARSAAAMGAALKMTFAVPLNAADPNSLPDPTKGLYGDLKAGRLPDDTFVHPLLDPTGAVNPDVAGTQFASRWLAAARDYPITGGAATFTWVPFIRKTQPAATCTAGDWQLYLFVMKRSPTDPPPSIVSFPAILPIAWQAHNVFIYPNPRVENLSPGDLFMDRSGATYVAQSISSSSPATGNGTTTIYVAGNVTFDCTGNTGAPTTLYYCPAPAGKSSPLRKVVVVPNVAQQSP